MVTARGLPKPVRDFGTATLRGYTSAWQSATCPMLTGTGPDDFLIYFLGTDVTDPYGYVIGVGMIT